MWKSKSYLRFPLDPPEEPEPPLLPPPIEPPDVPELPEPLVEEPLKIEPEDDDPELEFPELIVPPRVEDVFPELFPEFDGEELVPLLLFMLVLVVPVELFCMELLPGRYIVPPLLFAGKFVFGVFLLI